MSLSTLPLSYCTNVHPGRTVDEVRHGLQTYTIPAQAALEFPVAAGLWLAAPVVQELIGSPHRLKELQATLQGGRLACYTLNCFPYGDFHSERVKENVYLPDWTQPDRLRYTFECAQVLAQMMPEGTEGSLSTVPLGFKQLSQQSGFQASCIDQLLTLAKELDQLHDASGRVVRLAIEPEPLCVLETTPELLAFFQQLFQVAEERGLSDIANRHLGVCYDVCHQAVEFEDIPSSIRAIDAAGIRINKIHITCAIHVERPQENPQTLEELAQFAEPRYLHQMFAQNSSGRIASHTDLTADFCRTPAAGFQDAVAWRVHFHVPVHREHVGSLGTTRPEVVRALQAVAQLAYAPHLEVETYTWGVLPGEQPTSLVDGLVAELAFTRKLVEEQQAAAPTSD